MDDSSRHRKNEVLVRVLEGLQSWPMTHQASPDHRAISSRAAFVAMMQSPNLWKRDDRALHRRLHPPDLRRIFVQTEMRPPAVIISEIPFEHAVQMNSVQHNHVVQTFTPDRTN